MGAGLSLKPHRLIRSGPKGAGFADCQTDPSPGKAEQLEDSAGNNKKLGGCCVEVTVLVPRPESLTPSPLPPVMPACLPHAGTGPVVFPER